MQIPYDQDIDRAYRLMRQGAEDLRTSPDGSAKMLGDLEIAGIEQLGDGWLLVRARVKTLPLKQWSVRRELLKHLKRTFAREGAPADTQAACGVRLVVGRAAHEEGAGSLRATP